MDTEVDQQHGQKRETTILNVICALAVVGFLAFAGYSAVSSGAFFTTDNLFLIVVCLLFALVFAISPFVWLVQTGRITLPFTKNAAAASAAAEEEEVFEVEEVHFAGSNKLFGIVWGGLLALTLIEIILAYKPMQLALMLTILLGLSIIKAALIVAYFMHLKFERVSLIITLVPMLVICICLLFVFFPDSRRSIGLRYKFKEPPPQQKVAAPEE